MKPARFYFLVAGVSGRSVAPTVIAAVVHQVPRPHPEGTVTGRVVHVGESEAMGELVAGGTDSGKPRTEFEFVATGIGVDGDVVEGERATVVGRRERPFVRPDGARESARSLTVAGVDDVNLIYLAVLIPVVETEVDRILNGPTGLGGHLSRASIVIAVLALGPVIGHVVGQAHWPDHVERQVESLIALRFEVIVYAPPGSVLMRKSLLIGHAEEKSFVVASGEVAVGKLGEDDQALFMPCVRCAL